MKCEVLLLVDVFENVQEDLYDLIQIRPLDIIVFAPSLVWDAVLLRTGINVELLSHLDMHMIEKMQRGGLCFVVSQRYVCGK